MNCHGLTIGYAGSSGLLFGGLLAICLAGCDPAPPPGETSTLDLRTPSYTSDGVTGCHQCHAGEFNRVIAKTLHGDAANPDAPYGQHGCESCHGPGSFHVSRAHGGKGVPAMINFGLQDGVAPRDVQLEACQACHHPQATGAAAIDFTGSAHDSRYINCSSCHAMHVEVDPLSQPSGQAEICLECHRSQRDDHPMVRGRLVDFDKQACGDCHDIHPAASDEEIDFDF